MKKNILGVIFTLLVTLACVQVIVLGDPCASCVTNADCVNGRCVCNANYTGNAHFHCHRDNNLCCELLNDPVLTTFAHAKLKVHVLGATRFAQFMTTRSDTGQFCDFTLFAIMERIRGKIYPKSIEFQLNQMSFDSSSLVTFVLRLESTRQQDGSIVWQYFIDNQGPDTLTSDVAIPFNFCFIVLRVSPTWFVNVELSCCGITFGIRPYTGDDLYPPGLFVEIDSINQPTFGNWEPSNEPLCLDQGSFTFANIQTAQGLTDPVKAMTYHANSNTAGWAYLNSIFEVNIFQYFLNACDVHRRAKFLDYAWFSFTSAHFINCISQNNNANSLLYSFIIQALSYACNNVEYACQNIQQTVLTSCDITQYPFLQEFVNSTCTPLP